MKSPVPDYAARDLLEPRPPGSRPPADEVSWGNRRLLARAQGYEVHAEILRPDARRGIETPGRAGRTLVVVRGVLWTRDVTAGTVTRQAAGACIECARDRGLELAAGQEGATLLVVQPPGFDAHLERAAATVPPAPPRQTPGIRPPAPRRAQGTFEERTSRTMSALGLGRSQPVPIHGPRTAADVHFGFGPQGTNLTPVLPEP